MTILLPELISDQAVRLAFSNFGEVVSVFKGRHKFNRHIRNEKRHVRIFPARGDPTILPKRIPFYGNIQMDVLFAEKVVLCYRCKTRHMLGENCPVAAPTSEDSGMYLNEQGDTLSQNQNLYNLILLQRFFLALNPCSKLLLRRGMWLGETI